MSSETIETGPVSIVDPSHRLRRMTGRDQHEEGRAATPLELLFDLTFVVAFGAAGNELAHALADGHVRSGLISFAFCVFAICWAWINFTWFASAYDTDDWAFRVLTMVQMAGVIILTMGLPEVFASIDEGRHLDNGILVAGYVVMRGSMVGLWVRAAQQDPARRRCAMTYIVTILVSQVLWCLLLIPDIDVPQTFALIAIPLAIELSGPVIAERRYGGTPWHAHHMAERYGLLTIITLGEAVIGTVAAMSALVHDPALGWTSDAVIVLSAGIGLTFGMWWTYFSIPWSELLHHHRERSFFWGYGHMAIFGSIAATGAGLHVVQYYLEQHTVLGATGTLLTVVVPVAIYTATIYFMYAVSMRAADAFHLWLIAGTAVMLVAAVLLVSAGLSLSLGLVLVALAPLVTVVGYETVGHKHVVAHIERLRR
jgi:low temperature requirement protein LtrA